MRRLIAGLYAWALGIRIMTSEQHVADLEKMLSDLVSARDSIEAQITETTRRLMIARVFQNELIERRANPNLPHNRLNDTTEIPRHAGRTP